MMVERDGSPNISIVIPAYNEANYLPRLLDTIDRAIACYQDGTGAVEVIVADNNSHDNTVEIAQERGCLVAHVAKRNIARVRNEGAKLASGEVLCFVDADMRINAETFNSIERAINSGEIVAGSTGIKLERTSLGIAVTYSVLLPIAWLTKIDTGVVFCRKVDFEEIGGYDERLSIGEDVHFLTSLRELGRQRGQKLARQSEVKALGSSRKWDQHGDWHFLKIMVQIARAGGLNADQNVGLLGQYWYGEQREP
jgi:glycosyltransferase involved in cell wall biosynthesis